MPPVTVYSASPINTTTAIAASGITPKTTEATGDDTRTAVPPPTTTTTSEPGQPTTARPGAAAGYIPAAPTQAVQQQQRGGVHGQSIPTPTRTTDLNHPPPPQPGAVPVPPTASSGLPPPPKAGQTLPPQMAYDLSGQQGVSQGGSATATMTNPQFTQPSGPRPVMVQNLPAPTSNFGTPGQVNYSSGGDYHHHESGGGFGEGLGGAEEGEGVLGTAKKWAMAAGDSLAAAEHEIWRRINKD